MDTVGGDAHWSSVGHLSCVVCIAGLDPVALSCQLRSREGGGHLVGAGGRGGRCQQWRADATALCGKQQFLNNKYMKAACMSVSHMSADPHWQHLMLVAGRGSAAVEAPDSRHVSD